MRSFLPFLCKSLAFCAVLAGGTPSLKSATIIDANFNSGTLADAGLVDYSTLNNPVLTAGIGAGGSTGLNFGNNGGAATASMSIISTASFSMFGQFSVNDLSSGRADGSAMSFGWTKAVEPFRPFQGNVNGSSTVATTDTVMVGLARTATGGFSLGFGNGGTGAVHSNLFGNSLVFADLTASHWYRLEGTIQYNSLTGTFTFLDVSLDHFGADGSAEVEADLLYGTGGSLTVAGFGETGRAIWANNGDRGILVMDNYHLASVPEPTAAFLLGLGSFAVLFRRRRPPGNPSSNP